MTNNNNLKICFAIIMLFSVGSIKAQSLQQKFQKDMEQRKNHVNAVRAKANEQQLQQQAERSVETHPQHPSSGIIIQTNSQPAPVQQKKDEIKPQTPADIKKPLATKKVPAKAPH